MSNGDQQHERTPQPIDDSHINWHDRYQESFRALRDVSQDAREAIEAGDDERAVDLLDGVVEDLDTILAMTNDHREGPPRQPTLDVDETLGPVGWLLLASAVLLGTTTLLLLLGVV